MSTSTVLGTGCTGASVHRIPLDQRPHRGRLVASARTHGPPRFVSAPSSAIRSLLIHYDLIKVPFGHDRPGIVWLRLYRSGSDHVIVVTEVPGNPSRSMTNAIEDIASSVEAQFGILPGRLTLYEIWPRGSLGWDVSPDQQRLHAHPSTQHPQRGCQREAARLGGAERIVGLLPGGFCMT